MEQAAQIFIDHKLKEIKWLSGRTTDFTEDEINDIVDDLKIDFEGSSFDRSSSQTSIYYSAFDLWYDDFAENELIPYLQNLHAGPLKDYRVWVTWQECGEVKIQAHSAEEAYRLAVDNIDDLPLPKCGEYVDDSFEITSDTDQIKMINQEE